ncbi:MAG: hypothetical protein ACYDBT_03585 [Desulfobulbaceae bacterium]
MKKYNIMSAEEIILEVTRLAKVIGIDLSTNTIGNEYKNHVRAILKDKLSYSQLEALKNLTFGLISSTKNSEEKIVLGFAMSTVHSALIALRKKEINTKDVTIKLPEAGRDRYIQVFTALEGIREPFSHEDFHITYNNEDGSCLKISTSDGTVTWINTNGKRLMNTNLPDGKIRLCIKYFVSGLYQPLGKLEWISENSNDSD